MSEKKKTKKVKTVKSASNLAKFLHSQAFKNICGSLCIIFAFFLAVSIFSFLRAGGGDDNWLGSFGRVLARFFTNRLFGIASIGCSFLFVMVGLRLCKVHVPHFWRVMFLFLFWMTWISCVLGYIGRAWVSDGGNFENYAGMGYTVAGIMYDLLRWGALILLLFIGAVFLRYVHNVRFHLPQMGIKERASKLWNKFFESRRNDDAPAPVDDEEDDEPVDTQRDILDFEEVPQDDDAQPLEHDTPQEEADTKPFDIDDEFERINKKAQGDASNGPSFEIVATNDDDAATDTDEACEEEDEQNPAPANGDFGRHFTVDELYDPKLELDSFEMPNTSILENWESKNVKVTEEEMYANKDRIVSTLRDYGIEITDIKATPGPTVTLYEIKPAPGIRISKIKSLEDDIALSLAALGIRIIAPIPGKGTIGIEVPNANPQIVSMRTMLDSPAFKNNTKYELPIAIGKTISNEPFVTDLAKMPHLLMAGATGTGKSVGLNAVISSLLYKKHPAELKFVMVDPKKVELSLYNKIERHYLAKLPDSDEAIITDVKKVVRTLNSLCIEMDQRYDLLKLAQVRKITEYNDKFIHRQLNPERGHRYMPYIVLVIDEFADLIMTAGKEVETPICRLAQLARAVGIHLIIATQRPTTNIITGTIKANFPARIAFKVTSTIDSRTILDVGGAQRLIGRGDMLISIPGSDMVRLQCALIETAEIDHLVENISMQHGYPDGFLLPEYLDEDDAPNKDFNHEDKDEAFDDAARLIVESQLGSTSLLQRKMGLGYNRAGRVIDQMEAAGIVGPHNGSKPREVLIHDLQTLEELLKNL